MSSHLRGAAPLVCSQCASCPGGCRSCPAAQTAWYVCGMWAPASAWPLLTSTKTAWALCVPSEAHHQALRGLTPAPAPAPGAGGHDGADGDAEPPVSFISGGGDSCIRVWRDCTREQEQQRLLEQEQSLYTPRARTTSAIVATTRGKSLLFSSPPIRPASACPALVRAGGHPTIGTHTPC